MNPAEGRHPKDSVALIGFRGCGKTTVAPLLARRLGGDSVDTDQVVVEDAGRSIADIFAEEGEAGFRRREARAIERVTARPPRVIAVGGGGIEDAAGVRRLRSVALVVYLTAPADVLARRVRLDPTSAVWRPPLHGNDVLAELARVLERRHPLYEGACDLKVSTSGRTPADVAREIERALARPGAVRRRGSTDRDAR